MKAHAHPAPVIRRMLREWKTARNAADEAAIYLTDAKHAGGLGLPTLAAINYMLERVAQAHNYISRPEVETMLRHILYTAQGEATERIRIVLDDPSEDGVPGVPEIPALLLERNDR